MRILIVDDDAVFLRQLGKYMLAKNLSVDIAEGGKRALEMMRNERYDIVILDLKMPDMPGVEVLRQARQRGVQSKFIIVTGYGEIETAVETMKLGAADYIQKPFEAEELFNIIKELENIHGDAAEPVKWLKKICAGKEIFLITEMK
ncbi:MAG: two-component system response regulator, partial [Thermoplasmata archaeon]